MIMILVRFWIRRSFYIGKSGFRRRACGPQRVLPESCRAMEEFGTRGTRRQADAGERRVILQWRRS